MTEIELAEMLHSLALKGGCRQLVLATEHDLNGFEPKLDRVGNQICHDSCASWIALHPQHKIIRGFLVMDEDKSVFNRHSVIDTGRLELLDITTRPQNKSRNALEFIEFWDNPAIFRTLLNQVVWTPRTV